MNWKLDKYVNNGNVYFEVMNEPHGYSYSELVSLYDEWLNRFTNVPGNRIILHHIRLPTLKQYEKYSISSENVYLLKCNKSSLPGNITGKSSHQV